jgi:carbohydrate-binding DOMON domain-containing protein
MDIMLPVICWNKYYEQENQIQQFFKNNKGNYSGTQYFRHAKVSEVFFRIPLKLKIKYGFNLIFF